MQTTLSTATASWFLSRLLRTSGVGQRKRLSAHDYKSRSLVVCRSSQVTSHKSQVGTGLVHSIAFPPGCPRPSCLLPRRSFFPTSPGQGSLHDTTPHDTRASTLRGSEALRRRPASHRPGSRRFASGQPTPSLFCPPQHLACRVIPKAVCTPIAERL